MSSVLRILGVLDMLDRKQEGTLMLKKSESNKNEFTAMFAPNFGGGALKAKPFETRESLENFLSELDIPDEIRTRSIGEAESRGSATVPRVFLNQAQIEEYWPTQAAHAKQK